MSVQWRRARRAAADRSRRPQVGHDAPSRDARPEPCAREPGRVLLRPAAPAHAPRRAPALILLGVRRSGTTLLRVMLDRNPALAIPDESYFVPQLARRHRGSVDPAAFLDGLRRLTTHSDTWSSR